MNILFWIIVIIVSVIILCLLVFFILSYGFYLALKPNDPKDSIAEIKTFLGYDFGDVYEIIEHNSQNNHPDRPLQVVLKLNDNAINNIKKYASETESYPAVDTNNNQKYKHDQTIHSNSSYYIKKLESYEILESGDESYFFIATLNIDYDAKTLTYRETAI